MRVAVISDVHANFYALEAVREAISHEQVDEVWCLGDIVGYGPRPNECCAAVAEWCTLSLSGNHDQAAIGLLPLEEFSPIAAAAAGWTREQLDSRSREYLANLAPLSHVRGCELFHGSPREPVWDYVFSATAIDATFALTVEPLVLVGHTHFALAASLDDHLFGGLAPAGTTIEFGHDRWLVNPGSVGQPRDGDPRAAYLLLDLDAGRAEFARVEYAVERTQAEMRDLALPEQLVARLCRGI